MSKGKHTPLPWGQDGLDPDSIIGPDGKIIAVTGLFAHELDAAFIVRACNVHYELVEALEMAQDMLDAFPGFDSRAVPFTDQPTGNIGQVVRAAIAKAKGDAE